MCFKELHGKTFLEWLSGCGIQVDFILASLELGLSMEKCGCAMGNRLHRDRWCLLGLERPL